MSQYVTGKNRTELSVIKPNKSIIMNKNNFIHKQKKTGTCIIEKKKHNEYILRHHCTLLVYTLQRLSVIYYLN